MPKGTQRNSSISGKDMLGRSSAISASKALALVLENTPDVTTDSIEVVSIENSFGRVLAEKISSPEDLPGFDRSTVDGYAVKASDTFGASETAPAYLTVTNEIFMGEEPDFELRPGEVAKIATGGMLPKGADAVLMFEYAQLIENMLEAQIALAPGDKVIKRGEDIKKGAELINAGTRLSPYDVSAAAGLGITSLDVYKIPRVSIISTGDEIVPPETALKPGLIRDSNSYVLRGLIAGDGATPIVRGIFKDDFESIKSEMERSVKESDIVLITGGSSVGTKDMAERVISELGEVKSHGVTIRPGKPILFGVIDGTPVFGLPGHPRAVQVCFEVFVRPCIEKISGLKMDVAFEKSIASVKARITKSIHTAQGRLDIIPVRLELKEDGLWAEPLMGKSGLILSMVRAHGAFSIEVGSTGVEKGEEVSVELRKNLRNS